MASTRTFTLPHDPLTALEAIGEPSPRAIRILQTELYANASAIPSDLGGGDHGHLGMLMPNAEYILISTGGAAYGIPVRPQVPAFAGAAAVIAAIQEDYRRAQETYHTHRDLSNQIKKLILDAVPLDYLSELAHPTMGYSSVTPSQMLEHLVTNYGGITAKDLRDNMERLKTPWNPDTPIESVFTNGTFCRNFANEGNNPISDETYVLILVDIFEASGVLEKAIEDWEAKPVADQTLANAIPHFKTGNRLRLIKEAKTAKNTLAANQAISNQAIDQKLATKETGTLTGAGLKGWDYCYTHGICKHSGCACPSPKEGHKKEATMNNRMGGTNNLKPRKTKKAGGGGGQENEPPNGTP